MTAERAQERIEELKEFIKAIRSGAINGDIKAIKKMINKYQKIIDEKTALDKN